MKYVIAQLEREKNMIVDIGFRGGNYGAKAHDVVDALFPSVSEVVRYRLINALPDKLGAYCGYLGGGLRGKVAVSASIDEMVAHGLPLYAAKKVSSFLKACVARYIVLEGRMNNEIDEDGEVNWEARGTNKIRASGVVSAY